MHKLRPPLLTTRISNPPIALHKQLVTKTAIEKFTIGLYRRKRKEKKKRKKEEKKKKKVA